MGSIWRSLISGVLMYGAVTEFLNLNLQANQVLSLLVAVSIGVVTYGFVLTALIYFTGFRSVKEWSLLTQGIDMVTARFKAAQY